MLCQAAGPGMTFYNTSRFVFQPTEAAQGKKYVSLLSDQEQINANLTNFIAGFSANAREIFLDKFKFGDQINRLDEGNLLYLVLSKFTEIDLHPDVVDNIEMGYIFEELIRRFSEASNETAGEHLHTSEIVLWNIVSRPTMGTCVPRQSQLSKGLVVRNLPELTPMTLRAARLDHRQRRYCWGDQPQGIRSGVALLGLDRHSASQESSLPSLFAFFVR